MYERLAAVLVENLAFAKVSNILEVGCGSGQLTIHFVRKLAEIKPDFRLIALDLSTGPYTGHLNVLKRRVRKEGLDG